jgi:signal transduction histidine kinase
MLSPSRDIPISTDLGATYESIGVGSRRTHAVQFYEDDSFLVSSVGDYLASGLAVGQRVVAVATAEHRIAFRAHLRARGFDVDRAVARRQLAILDASELLSTFMTNGLPDAGRCRTSVGGLLRQMSPNGDAAPLRVFGEMVDVLCRSGNIAGALALEKIWNELAQVHRFSLLCGYSLKTFSDDAHAPSVELLCGEHAHVIPTERFTQADAPERMREVTRLQQRARALETELERRKEMEASLRDALTRAEGANRTKTEFLAAMSHELRTPLNAIGGHVQLVEMEVHGPINDVQRDALARVQRSQRHLLGLINNVLNLTPLESEHVEFAIETLAVDDLLDEATSLLAPLFRTSLLACDIVRTADAAPLHACADEEKVQQILLNILGNALKFTPEGGHVTLRAEALPGAADMIAISIRDDGIGIPPHKLASVFEPFVQLGTPPSGRREGVGLGLSISRTLARGMGGDLTVDSEPGSGSTFTLTLPRA